MKPNIKFERDDKQMLAAAQIGVTAQLQPIDTADRKYWPERIFVICVFRHFGKSKNTAMIRAYS